MAKDFESQPPGEIKEAEGKSRCPLELYLCLLGVRELNLVTRDLLICALFQYVLLGSC